ncbi:MAG: tRNA (adenosine(37)-N6)-threonylcarbamoyltransferase complex ATPase subunit type 1 TsaE [Bacteroidaceae bacterium]|nr:tRNA (adenosine(37)-N6)-threonylcarbamoyltransferase complex ATPase subunit type 1 TsaE [Bacteroidaceae bacterium]
MELQINNLEEIGTTAREFIRMTADATVIAFYGSMGAGKTTFVRALCEAKGVSEAVTSPTFAIVNEYQSAALEPIYHFDFYRIRRLSEAYDMGFEDYLYSGHLCLIEWPELVEELLPENTVRVHIDVNDDGTRTVRW